ncbi:MAG TPA: hypothetical protein VI007_05615 [bacterium]
MKVLLMAGFLALLLFITSRAETTGAPRDQQPTVYLQIRKSNAFGGTIKGLYSGTAVDGTFTGGTTDGTFTLMANGMVLANGTYFCDPSGCVFRQVTPLVR